MYSQEAIIPYAKSEGGKREQMERMFNHISSTYDILNLTLSLGIDRRWRKHLVSELAKSIPHESLSLVLDVATGTADLSIMAAKALPHAQVLGIDISDGMMEVGHQKVAHHGLTDRISFLHADCTSLPQADDTFDAVISSFGLRNFQHLDLAYSEMKRVLKKNGHMFVMDLCTPVNFPMKQLFWIYKRCVMPFIGRFISHDHTAYTYLPATMDAVPQGDDMVAIIRKAGWRNVTYKQFFFGMCMLYSAEK